MWRSREVEESLREGRDGGLIEFEVKGEQLRWQTEWSMEWGIEISISIEVGGGNFGG